MYLDSLQVSGGGRGWPAAPIGSPSSPMNRGSNPDILFKSDKKNFIWTVNTRIQILYIFLEKFNSVRLSYLLDKDKI